MWVRFAPVGDSRYEEPAEYMGRCSYCVKLSGLMNLLSCLLLLVNRCCEGTAVSYI